MPEETPEKTKEQLEAEKAEAERLADFEKRRIGFENGIKALEKEFEVSAAAQLRAYPDGLIAHVVIYDRKGQEPLETAQNGAKPPEVAPEGDLVVKKDR